MHSCIFQGFVRHRRFQPVSHSFHYSIFQMYLDLDELPDLFRPYPLWSAGAPAIAWFRREDHLGDPERDLAECVRDEVEQQTSVRPDGPIRLLTNLRYFGYVMNPVSYFYCFDRRDGRLQAVLAEVNNTPWGERHCYVIHKPVGRKSGASKTRWIRKAFHVSPFMQMQMRYRWQISEPGRRLAIHIANHSSAEETGADINDTSGVSSSAVFDVTLSLCREEITGVALRRVLMRHPLMTAKVTAAIYWQALRLWWKRVPFVAHPGRRAGNAEGVSAF